MAWLFDVGVLLEAIEVLLLLLGRCFAELEPSDADRAFGLEVLIP